MRVIVTRPAAQAADWVIALHARQLDAVALPLIGIAAVDEPAPLLAAWRALVGYRLVMFVSANAAHHFFALQPRGRTWPASLWAASPGPGTTRALIGLGVPAPQIIEPPAGAPQFDSESLWLRLQRQDWQDAEVLIVRGDGGRDWLADMLGRHGARVTHLAAYRRTVPQFDAGEQAVLLAALGAPAAHLWFFSSSEAITHLAALVPPGTGWRHAQALATHPRIAAKATQLGFARVIEARPALDDVIACIQSIRP